MPNEIQLEIIGADKVRPETLTIETGNCLRWLNTTDEPYQIVFQAPSPFEGGATIYLVEPGKAVVSEPIAAHQAEFKYHVWPTQSAERSTNRGPQRFEPTIVVRKPNV